MTSRNQNFSRLFWIDQIKGIAILGIVIFHFFQNYPHTLLITKTLSNHLPKVGFAMVDIFFLISGFNASFSLNKYSDLEKKSPQFWLAWLKKRLIRIYSTYWLAIAYIYLLMFIFNREIKLNSLSNFFLVAIGFPDYNLFKLINPGFWFVTVIIQAYLLIPFLLSLARQKPQVLLFIGITIAIINKLICFVILLFYGSNAWLYYFLLQTNFIGSYFFPLCLGLYWGIVFNINSGFSRKSWLISSFAFIIGVLWQTIVFLNQSEIRYKLGLDLLVIPFLALILYKVFTINTNFVFYKYFKQFLAYLGRNSYPLYLIHQPIFFIFIILWLQKTNVNSYFTFIFTAVLVFINLILLLTIFMKADFYLSKIVKSYL